MVEGYLYCTYSMYSKVFVHSKTIKSETFYLYSQNLKDFTQLPQDSLVMPIIVKKKKKK